MSSQLNIEKHQLLTVNQLAERLQVPKSWIYDRTRTNQIPCHRFGKYVRFDLEEVIAYFKDLEMRRG